MPSDSHTLAPVKIAINHLKPGMYVLSITSKKSSVSIKSEGYINTEDSINKLKRSGIVSVTIDPSRDKNNKQVDSEVPEDACLSAEDDEAEYDTGPNVSFEKEMKTASKLYEDAKGLQRKILTAITKNKEIDMDAVQESTDAIVDSIFRNQDALSCMSRLRIKDEYLVEHSLNVSILMTIFAKHLKMEREIIEQLALGAFLHDIGKIKVPSEVLNKPGRLTDEEFEIIKGHVMLGVAVLKETDGFPENVLDMVQDHHERLNGKGYPNQISADDLGIHSRMIAIVDSYDAMTAERVYKSGMNPITAFKNLIKDSPYGYDEELVEQFVACLGVYPVGTLVKLNSGKLGIISKLNKNKPLQPFVRVFYNTRLNQAIAMEEIDLSQAKANDHIDCCIKEEDYNINLLAFFKMAFDC